MMQPLDSLACLEGSPTHPVESEGFPLTFGGVGTGPKHEQHRGRLKLLVGATGADGQELKKTIKLKPMGRKKKR